MKSDSFECLPVSGGGNFLRNEAKIYVNVDFSYIVFSF